RRPPTALRGETSSTVSRSLRIACDRAILQAEEGPSARNLHAAGVAHLLLGELDAAVVALRKASERDPDPRILSDLSAAYCARGRTRSDPSDFQDALQTANEALARNP